MRVVDVANISFDRIDENGQPEGANICTYVMQLRSSLSRVRPLSFATNFGRCESAAPRMGGPLAYSEVGKH